MKVQFWSAEIAIPIGLEVVRKLIQFYDVKTQQVKREKLIIKSELMRDLLDDVVKN